MLGRADAPKEEETRRTGEKEITTKAAYSQALVRQENARIAELTRLEAKNGEEIIKTRQRAHTSQGLSRQQAAMTQMKRASESLEAHRQQNLVQGRKVYEQVAGWSVKAKSDKEEWAVQKRTARDAVKADNVTAAAVKELTDSKKAFAALTRKEDQEKEQAREKLKKEREKEVAALAEQVRAATSDAAIDAGKRMFYEQRLASANEIKSASAMWSKERTEKHQIFEKAQTARKVKAKAVRASAGKAREALLAQRYEEASASREKKKALTEEHKTRMQEDYMKKSSIVKRVISDKVYDEDGNGSPNSPGGYLRSPGSAGGVATGEDAVMAQ